MDALPSFKYHPDPIATGSVVASDEPCEICGMARGAVYSGPVYAVDEIETVCPWCIADGRVATEFEAKPLGEDRWLRPKEWFTVRSDYEGPKAPFQIDFWMSESDRAASIENLNCWVNEGDAYAEVRDESGALIECGHQRPADVDARWTAQLAELKMRQRNMTL